MLERYLLVWLCLSSGAALMWSQYFAWDPFVASEPYLPYLVAVAMFAVGWLLPRDELAELRRRWPTVAAGTALQYGVMPLLSFLCARAFALDTPAAIGTIMAGCVPGAMASNVLTMLGRGNTSYSVCLTTCSTLLSPLAVPLGLAVFLSAAVPDFPIRGTMVQLARMVVLPVLLGHACSRSLPQFDRWARRIGSTIANLTILWIIAVVVSKNRGRLDSIDLRLLAALTTLNLGGYAAGWWGGGRLMGLDRPMRKALTLEIGMQNAGLGTVLVGGLFPDQPQATIPTALFTFGCMFTGTLLAAGWAWQERRVAHPTGERPA